MDKNQGKFKKVFNAVIDYLFPKDVKCIFCGEEIRVPNKYHACEYCLKTLPYNNERICEYCGGKIEDLSDYCIYCFTMPPPYKIARAPFLYDYPVSSRIVNFKFDNAKFLFAPLGEYIVDTYEKYNYDCDVIIPVPLSNSRLKQRKYNQAELLSQKLAEKYNLPILTDVIKRVKDTAKQSNLSLIQRKENLQEAFKLYNKKAIKGKNILVIDDVMTTGETIKNLCYELHKGKPKNIFVITLAHTFHNRKKYIKKQNFLLKLFNKKLEIIKENVKLKYNEHKILKDNKKLELIIKKDLKKKN